MSQMTSGIARGHGANSNVVEREHDASYPNGGLITDIPLGINDWTTAAGVQLPGVSGTTAFRQAVQGNLVGIRWDNAAAATPVVTTIKLPGEYDAQQDECIFIGTFRYVLGGSDNATLRMLARADYFQPGQVNANLDSTTRPVAGTNATVGEATIQTIDPTVATGVTLGQNQWSVAPGTQATNLLVQRALPVAVAAAVNTFYDYAFNFSFNTPAKLTYGANSINLLKPHSIVGLSINPSAAVGASNFVDFLGGVLRIRRNLSINPRAARFARGTIR